MIYKQHTKRKNAQTIFFQISLIFNVTLLIQTKYRITRFIIYAQWQCHQPLEWGFSGSYLRPTVWLCRLCQLWRSSECWVWKRGQWPSRRVQRLTCGHHRSRAPRSWCCGLRSLWPELWSLRRCPCTGLAACDRTATGKTATQFLIFGVICDLLNDLSTGISWGLTVLTPESHRLYKFM